MKILKKATINRYNITCGLFAVLFLFPIMPNVAQSISFFSFVGLSIFFYKNNVKTFIRNKKRVTLYLILTGFYWLIVISFFWSNNLDRYIKEIRPSILLGLFPFVLLFFHPSINGVKLKLSLRFFVFGLIVYLMFWFFHHVEGISIYQEISAKESPIRDENFINQIKYFIERNYRTGIGGRSLRGHQYNGGTSFFVHSTYISTYYLLGIISCIKLYSKESIIIKLSLVILTALFSFFIIYLSSKIVLLLLVFVLTFTFFKMKNQKIKFFVLGAILVLVSYKFSYVKSKFKNLISYRLVEEKENIIDESGFLDLKRVKIYECALEENKGFFLFGLGIGDVQAKINSCLTSKYPNQYKTNYNPHSQPLHYFLAAGIFSVALFIFSFLFFFFWFFNKGNWFGVLIVMVFLGVSIFESFLSRIYGVLPFVLFIGLSVNNEIKNITKGAD